MTGLFFSMQAWLVLALALGALEMLTGSVVLGGVALGAAVAAAAVALFGEQMQAAGLHWAVPVVIWAVGSLAGVAVVNALFGRRAEQGDVNDAPYKGDKD